MPQGSGPQRAPSTNRKESPKKRTPEEWLRARINATLSATMEEYYKPAPPPRCPPELLEVLCKWHLAGCDFRAVLTHARDIVNSSRHLNWRAALGSANLTVLSKAAVQIRKIAEWPIFGRKLRLSRPERWRLQGAVTPAPLELYANLPRGNRRLISPDRLLALAKEIETLHSLMRTALEDESWAPGLNRAEKLHRRFDYDLSVYQLAQYLREKGIQDFFPGIRRLLAYLQPNFWHGDIQSDIQRLRQANYRAARRQLKSRP